jgi:preprotein translocase subunit SecA
MLNRAIENAQRKVEAHNFDIRKHLLEYDDVANDQRRVVYGQRNDLMEGEDVHEAILDFRQNVFENLVNNYIPEGSIDEQWDIPGLEKALEGEFGIKVPVHDWLEADEHLAEEDIKDRISDAVTQHFEAKEAQTGPEVMRHFEKALMLNVLDQKWKDHLGNMDYLRQGIHLRGYAQKQPMQEYKRESFEMFTALLDDIQREVVKILARVQVRAEEDVEAVETQRRQDTPMEYHHAGAPSATADSAQAAMHDEPYVREGRKVGRNEPCPCGSGKKYKQCHGKLT